jgi:hypothetical protein
MTFPERGRHAAKKRPRRLFQSSDGSRLHFRDAIAAGVIFGGLKFGGAENANGHERVGTRTSGVA